MNDTVILSPHVDDSEATCASVANQMNSLYLSKDGLNRRQFTADPDTINTGISDTEVDLDFFDIDGKLIDKEICSVFSDIACGYMELKSSGLASGWIE